MVLGGRLYNQIVAYIFFFESTYDEREYFYCAEMLSLYLNIISCYKRCPCLCDCVLDAGGTIGSVF